MKTKIFSKRKELANGKIIVTDFKRLNPADFPLYNLNRTQIREELGLIAPDGKLYINSKMIGHDFASEVFEILVKESRKTLQEFQREYQKIFPDIKTFDDWVKMEDTDERRTQAFAMLTVPTELKRREIEASYTGKVMYFPK